MTLLICPSCGDRYPASERFCASCRVPLVFAAEDSGDVPVSERHQRARKVKPQLAEGDLVKVAGARHQAEAEFIQGLDVPDFLAAGPRDVLVPQSGVATAREVLMQAELITSSEPAPTVAPLRLLAGLLIALAIGALIAWLVLSVQS